MLKFQRVISLMVFCLTISQAKQMQNGPKGGEAIETSFIKRAINDFVAHGAR